jgi:transcriptional regulator with XRE-family HTH domain
MSTKKATFSLKDLEKRHGKLTLGRFVASWRLAADISQKEFAKMLGISPANLCDIEKGRKGVSIFKATEIAKAIGYSPTMLVQLALQEQMESSGLDFTVEVKTRAA